MKKTKYCKSDKFPLGPNTGKFSKRFFKNVFPPHQKRLKKKIAAFKNVLKRRLTRFRLITEKYCKSEKFPIGHNTEKFFNGLSDPGLCQATGTFPKAQ